MPCLTFGQKRARFLTLIMSFGLIFLWINASNTSAPNCLGQASAENGPQNSISLDKSKQAVELERAGSLAQRQQSPQCGLCNHSIH
jgi:hypothetical protein